MENNSRKILNQYNTIFAKIGIRSQSPTRYIADEKIENIRNSVEALRISNISSKISSSLETRKAKRVRFFRNGDRYFTGILVPITTERYRTLEMLIEDLSHQLKDNVTLPSGVRSIYTMNGQKITKIDQFENDNSYVCCGNGETFRRTPYIKLDLNQNRRKSRVQSLSPRRRIRNAPMTNYLRGRLIILIRNGIKPRKVLRFLINKCNSASMTQLLEAITEAVHLDSGAARKVFTLYGELVTSLAQFFEDEIFLVYGNERYSSNDLELDFQEKSGIMELQRTSTKSTCCTPQTRSSQRATFKTNDSDERIFAKLITEDLMLLPALKHKFMRDKY